MLAFLLFIAKKDLALSTAGDEDYSELLRCLNPSWRSPNTTQFTTVFLPLVAKSVKEYIKKELKGRFVSIIVDEMTNNNNCYLNFVLATRGAKNISQLYFWDCKESCGRKALDIAQQILGEINHLEENGIHCNSYVTDNCNTMRSTEKLVNAETNETITRIPCSSHILNNILKDFIDKIDCLNSLWNHVCFIGFSIQI